MKKIPDLPTGKIIIPLFVITRDLNLPHDHNLDPKFNLYTDPACNFSMGSAQDLVFKKTNMMSKCESKDISQALPIFFLKVHGFLPNIYGPMPKNLQQQNDMSQSVL